MQLIISNKINNNSILYKTLNIIYIIYTYEYSINHNELCMNIFLLLLLLINA